MDNAEKWDTNQKKLGLRVPWPKQICHAREDSIGEYEQLFDKMNQHAEVRPKDHGACPNGYGSIPIDTFLVGWTSIYQLFWGSLGTRVLTHPQIHWISTILWLRNGLVQKKRSWVNSPTKPATCGHGKPTDVSFSSEFRWANMEYFPWPSARGVTCVSWWLTRPILQRNSPGNTWQKECLDKHI